MCRTGCPSKGCTPRTPEGWFAARLSLSYIWAKLGATRCLAVVQGTIRSWVPLGFPSPAIGPMANAGEVPKFLRWEPRRGV